ncbi:hypothetical protein E2C01_049339 [Portunus trituberculatus]|uniref:Uncharacterized protein n=1 Tax=Portunus trituberculatus TaxID=210409 RepID=A0A5B7GFS9_PORTR|nr:hypothetical protein [Portunus trituberculatus]
MLLSRVLAVEVKVGAGSVVGTELCVALPGGAALLTRDDAGLGQVVHFHAATYLDLPSAMSTTSIATVGPTVVVLRRVAAALPSVSHQSQRLLRWALLTPTYNDDIGIIDSPLWIYLSCICIF